MRQLTMVQAVGQRLSHLSKSDIAALAARAASFLPQAVAANLPDTSAGQEQGVGLISLSNTRAMQALLNWIEALLLQAGQASIRLRHTLCAALKLPRCQYCFSQLQEHKRDKTASDTLQYKVCNRIATLL